MSNEKKSQRTHTGHGFGTAPVFLASISTILGAILFLRFGYAVANVGLWGALMIILVGHLVTIPTALAVSEIATNRRVAGGGAYFIISRSFGTTIGGAIGIALYVSQAISVAFYLVAFAAAFEPAYAWIGQTLGFAMDPRMISVPVTLLIIVLMLKKGAAIGVQALWVVVVILVGSIGLFLVGEGPVEIRPDQLSLVSRVTDADGFGRVFAICFPAFTGMIAGLGLSGDLKKPERAIPIGIITATCTGMLVYALVAVKLAQSATPEVLNADQFVMARIALWGPAVYVGLAAATLSSALGSMIVAPRTLQALARDRVLAPRTSNRWLAAGTGKEHEPVNATIVSGIIALLFVLIGDINFISQILSMFFMVTYGALCTVSFLEYFSGNPAYRPTFRSRWYVSLLGAAMSLLMMIQMNAVYAFLSLAAMALIYAGLRRTRAGERDLGAILQGTMFQLTRRLQISLQKNRAERANVDWRPSFVAVTRHSEERLGHFDLLRWICQRHGFGQFIHFIEGEYSLEAERDARVIAERLVHRTEVSHAGVYVDTLICPSFGQALAQVLQLPGVSGLPNNSVLLEFDREHTEELPEVIAGTQLALHSGFNTCVLRSSDYRFGYRASVHIWLTDQDVKNATLMILLAYIIVGHPEWARAEVRLFTCVKPREAEEETDRLSEMLEAGHLPISRKNVIPVHLGHDTTIESAMRQHSADVDLAIVGLSDEDVSSDLGAALTRYAALRDVVFVSAARKVPIF